jgi:hypothetical protein
LAVRLKAEDPIPINLSVVTDLSAEKIAVNILL